jgi:hypothetical protein
MTYDMVPMYINTNTIRVYYIDTFREITIIVLTYIT